MDQANCYVLLTDVTEITANFTGLLPVWWTPR